MSVIKKPSPRSFVAYKILAALLYPRGSSNILITSWEDRQFFLTRTATQLKVSNKVLKDQLEYLRQAGFIQSIKHHKEPGYNGKAWSQVKLIMPTDGSQE